MNEKVLTPEYAPTRGVRLRKGMLFEAFQNNRTYLKKYFTLGDLLYPFQERVGMPCTRSRPLAFFWETDLEGSNAGRFLMGAGNTLCYCDDTELKDLVQGLVDGIRQCADADGYCMGFHKEDFMILERANYTRSWLTRGLLAAQRSGSEAAGQLIRHFQNWFNSYPSRRKAAELHLSYQGMIADMEMALSSGGKQEDWEKSAELYVNESWITDLLANRTATIWRRPNDGAHGYEINAMIAYFDLYLLSGESRYLQAVLAAWQMFKDYWIHIGGSVAICEEHDAVFNYAPASRFISADKHTGETCNNVWWVLLNQRLLQMFPDEEKYAREIEESLYNVLLPAQSMSNGIRYHTNLHGVKDAPYTENTCCEGTGTMLYGMLPSLIYHLHAEDAGVTVNLFADSEITRAVKGCTWCLSMNTDFPAGNLVTLTVSVSSPIEMPLRIRIPSWVSEDVVFLENGTAAQTGKAGTYVTLKKIWHDGDQVKFELPRCLSTKRYYGMSVIRDYERYALMNGPILMAICGQPVHLDSDRIAWNEKANIDFRANWNAVHWIGTQNDTTGAFIGENLSMQPYYQVPEQQIFTCYPLVRQHSSILPISPEMSFQTGIRRKVTCGDVEFELIGIPKGTFLMGQEGFEPCEQPVHTEMIQKSFFLGVYPVTQGQYVGIMGCNPSAHVGEDLPVEMVSYEDALNFISCLNNLQDALTFRLPEEAEWEYACRAGTRDISGYGTDILRNFSQYMWNYQQLGTQSVQTNNLPTTHPVGKKLQNSWGLYDMLGNVGEWCMDAYQSYDKNGFCDQQLRTIRGGSYTDLATYCRCATRNALESGWKNRFTGFRLAADLRK